MSTRWISGGRRPSRAVLDRIVGYFHRVARPVYLGHAAVEVGYSLNQTQAMFEALQEAGVLKPLTDAEKRERDIAPFHEVWVLVDKVDPGQANW